MNAWTGDDPIQIVPMLLEDIRRVVEIDQLSFPLPWSSATYRYELTQNPNSHFFVALAAGNGGPAGASSEGRLGWLNPANWFRPPPAPLDPERPVIGYAGFWYVIDEAHISTIAVHPDWRGRHVGERLLVAMLERALDLNAATATLEVRVTNERAQNLYRKYAFDVVGRRKRYYRDNGEDALLMTAELNNNYRAELLQRFGANPKGVGSKP